MNKIYSKIGDNGNTQLLSGKEVNKDDIRIDSYGTIDELSCVLGLLTTKLNKTESKIKNKNKKKEFKRIKENLYKIQNLLFIIGSHLSCDKKELKKIIPPFYSEYVLFLENEIDNLSQKIFPLKNFIVPGGHEISCILHLARSICRRSERNTITLHRSNNNNNNNNNSNSNSNNNIIIDSKILKFLNRLSDYFFMEARFFNQLNNIKDKIWKKEDKILKN